MTSKKDISIPKKGMNRASSPHLLSEGEFSFQKNGNSYDEGGEKYNLTDEHSNILAVVFPDGYKVVGVKNHIIRNKTYIFLTNPETGCSEIGYIENTKEHTYEKDTEKISNCTDCPDYKNTEATPLEEENQNPHQEYNTLLSDCCTLDIDSNYKCLNFNIDNPIIDIVIKEQNIGTRIFWTESPGNNELRYLDLDDLDQYTTTGESSCDNIPSDTCLDCNKLRVFKLYSDLKAKTYSRSLGGNLKKGTYEVLGAYCDELGNEFTSYTTLSSMIPIFDESNVVHEQEDNNAETNFSIKLVLDNVDEVYEYYKIAVRYYTSKGVFSSFVEGVHNTVDKIVNISNNNGQAISNAKLSVKKPFIETVDGITASNNILFLNGVREREPFNLQPVINLAGLGMKWMSYRAKEDLYSNSDSYKYTGYNRDENVLLSIDFGLKSGGRTNLYHFIPRPAKESETAIIDSGMDYNSITSIVKNCDSNDRQYKWQFYNTASEGIPCSTEEIETVNQTEEITVYTSVDSSIIPQIPSGTITITTDLEDFTTIEEYIEDYQDSYNVFPYTNSELESICQYIDLNNLTSFNNQPQIEGDCTAPVLDVSEEKVIVGEVIDKVEINTNKKLEDYNRTRPSESCFIVDEDTIDEDFSSQYALDYLDATINNVVNIEDELKKRQNITYAPTCNSSIQIPNINNSSSNVGYLSVVHPYFGASQESGVTLEDKYINALEDKNALHTAVLSQNEVGGTSDGAVFLNKIHKGALWFEIDVQDKEEVLVEISSLLDSGGEYWRLGDLPGSNLPKFKNTNVRVHFFYNCSMADPISVSSYTDENGLNNITPLGGIYDLRNNNPEERTNQSPSIIPIDNNIIQNSNVRSGKIYMVIDLPLSKSVGLGEGVYYDDSPNPTSSDIIDTVVTVPLNSCFSVNTREIELSKKEISFSGISVTKLQKWSFNCNYEIPVLKDCEPVPYFSGELGYYESKEKYPDNSELYNSSTLAIKKEDITSQYFLNKIQENYQDSEDLENIYLSEEANFSCKNIRAYKLPDNKISPFINTNTIGPSSESIIFPLGFTIDGEVIANALDIAVRNNLITEEQRSDIIDYKFYRSDSELDRSVVSSGIVFNTKQYTKEQEVVNYINYPYNSLGEDKFFNGNVNEYDDDMFDKLQVISPEFDYFRPSLPDELSVQGYMFGRSRSRILPVDNHSKMVILGSKARNIATTLAVLEVVAEGVINVAQSAEVYRVDASIIGASVNPVGIGLNIAVALLEAASSIAYKVSRYRLEWLRSFENLGAPYNFGYYIASVSNYNNLKTIQTEDNILRGVAIKKYLKPGLLSLTDPSNGDILNINNIDREEAPFFTLGDFPITVPETYKNFDNNNINSFYSSQILSSESGNQEGKGDEQLRNIASPYVSFKNYIPDQYGNIDSVRWIDTGFCYKINDLNTCEGFLGGDTFITRHTKKRKVRIFETDLLGQADLTPFPYRYYGNYGDPKYYIDYKVNSDFEYGGKTVPDIFYDVKFDSINSANGFYVEPPGKFYLYSISYPSFLCETRINTNFRNARKEPWNQFYPQNSDYEEITQPNTVALTRPENYFYNRAYLQTSVLNSNTILPSYYSSDNESLKAYNTNTIQYSLPDVNENSITEPWLLYRPNDKATLESTYGNLVNIKGIESDQILLFFENALQLQNSVNQFTDGQTQYNTDLGNGGIFGKRALTLRTTDIGYGGTQSKQTLSCEFGHFYADTKRGQVFKYTGGSNLEEISRYSNGIPNGMDVWFKEHLPLKFIKYFPNYDKLDNSYNGIGIHWGYDSKYRRVLLTKKDYTITGEENIIYDPVSNLFSNGMTFQENVKEGNFKDISWTITFKPELNSWESYMSYLPNYYINHTDYFQSGINSDNEKQGLWSHLLTNKSYRVFYGQKYPYIIEYPVKNEYFSKRLDNINWNAQLRRYHNDYDFAVIEDNPFTSITIYNDYENSGKLIPVKNTGTISQLSRYPITNKNNTQDVLISYDNYRYNVNYFYNRVKSNTNNQPIWNWDENQIDKNINNKAVSFYGKKTLERMKGNYFMVRLERDGNTNYDLDFRWSEQDITSTN